MADVQFDGDFFEVSHPFRLTNHQHINGLIPTQVSADSYRQIHGLILIFQF